MNFDKLFFRLLIIKTLYQCGLSQLIEVAPISEIFVVNHEMRKYTRARLSQYGDDNFFSISDSQNATLYLHYFEGDFSSKSIEFDCMYDLEMEFLYRRPDTQILWLKCVFSEKKFIQAFFQKIYSYQEKGVSVMIFRIARYFDETRQIEPYVKNATMYSKDITEFTNDQVQRTYFITHFNETNSTIEVEADLIFPAKNFAISDIYEYNKIALCIYNIPGIRFLIRFTDQTAGQRFLTEHMPEAMQRDDLPCKFPENLSSEQILENLDLF